jgi:5-methylcytosine-specific restriction endonuclease McrA
MQVLALDIAGIPRSWISLEQSVVYYAKDQVAWAQGSPLVTFNGGIQRDGTRSSIETNSIIALQTSKFSMHRFGKIFLTNKTLFGRDRYTCAYCGVVFGNKELSRDHIIPRSKGGENSWMNVVAACIECNTRKANRTPERAGMQLLYAPYSPNHYENLILINRRVLADQMEFLKHGLPKHSRVA